MKYSNKQKLIDEHYELCLNLAFLTVRVTEIDKEIKRKVNKLIKLEIEIEQIELKENNRDIN